EVRVLSDQRMTKLIDLTPIAVFLILNNPADTQVRIIPGAEREKTNSRHKFDNIFIDSNSVARVLLALRYMLVKNLVTFLVPIQEPDVVFFHSRTGGGISNYQLNQRLKFYGSNFVAYKTKDKGSVTKEQEENLKSFDFNSMNLRRTFCTNQFSKFLRDSELQARYSMGEFLENLASMVNTSVDQLLNCYIAREDMDMLNYQQEFENLLLKYGEVSYLSSEE
ncbi:hypothetical protein, partial [Flagellimonas marinaquae]